MKFCRALAGNRVLAITASIGSPLRSGGRKSQEQPAQQQRKLSNDERRDYTAAERSSSTPSWPASSQPRPT